jgi:hypothetical protein
MNDSSHLPKTSPSARDILVAYSPVALALVVLIPRLFSAQFGLLDDGYTLSVVRQVAGGNLGILWESGAARSRPIYWLYFTLLYKLAGPNPFWFFVGNALLFAAATACLVYLVRAHGASPRRSFVTGLLFVLAGPVVESYLTLSKPEPLQILLMMSAVVLVFGSSRSSGLLFRLGGVVVGACLLLLADLTKETTLALIPISAAWLLGAWFRRRGRPGREEVRPAASLLAAAALSGLAFLALRYRFSTLGLPEDAYAGNYLLDPERLIASAVRWGGWLLRDFSYLGLVVLAAALLPQVRRRAIADSGILASLVWIGGWVAVYLPWVFTVEYYLLPVALGAAVAGGCLMDGILAGLRSLRPWARPAVALCLGLGALLFVFSVGNNLSNARQQLMIDAANEEALRWIGTSLPESSRLLVNLQFPGEYVEEIRLHLSYVWDRPDIRVEPVQMDRLPAAGEEDSPSYLLESIVVNQPLLTVRSGAIEVSVREWNRMLEEYVAGSGVLVTRVEREMPLNSLNFVRFLCPVLSSRGFCETDEPIIDRRVYTYGWELYRIADDATGSRGAGPAAGG